MRDVDLVKKMATILSIAFAGWVAYTIIVEVLNVMQ